MRRIRHTAYLCIGILKEYRGKGIATRFFDTIEEWARNSQISRLELTVLCHNEIGLGGVIIRRIQLSLTIGCNRRIDRCQYRKVDVE